MSAIAEYKGPFGKAQAERLLWRAGFGAKPGEAEALAKLGFKHAVHALTRPPSYALSGPTPTADKGRPLAPAAVVGDDHLFWLDKMVRTNAPLIERMTLIWHSWFATSNQGVASQQLMLEAERPLPGPGVRLVQRSARRGHPGSGDADLAERQPEREGAPERELRARDDGALHARRRPGRLHRDRRARERAGAHRLDRQREQGDHRQLRLQREPARLGLEDDLRPHGHLHLDGLVQPLRQPSAAFLVLRREALELLHPHAARRGHAQRLSRRCT